MTSYDPVNYSDKAYFHTPSDGHYLDDPQEKHINGNGIYNDYTVELKPKEYRPTFRFLCCTCKNTKRVKFVIFGAFLVFCLALVLIIVSAVAHHHQTTAQNQQKDYGLLAYGPDKDGVISFSVMDHKTYMDVFNRLEEALHDYSAVRQESHIDDKYIPCTDNMTSVPAGKVCMQLPKEFGSNCQNRNLYGLTEAKPCVLLVLKLEKDFIPKPFNFTGMQNVDIHRMLGDRSSDTSVGISCDGKTDSDKKLIGTDKREGGPINYNPRNGFPLYYFLNRNTEGYINPAVMVQFTTLPTHHTVTVKCTAWAENFNNGHPENSSKYSTEFTFKLL